MASEAAVRQAIRLAIVGPYTLFGQSLRAFFNAHPDFGVAWTAVTTAEAHRQFENDHPDVVLLDADLKHGNSMDLARHVAAGSFPAKVVILTAHVCNATLQWALKLKLSGYLLKDDTSENVIAGIKRAFAGDHCWSPAVERRLKFNSETGAYQLSDDGPARRLTLRQTEIVIHLAQGASAKEVARRLHLAETSINSHTYRIMKTLDIHDRVELTHFAIREGLIVP